MDGGRGFTCADLQSDLKGVLKTLPSFHGSALVCFLQTFQSQREQTSLRNQNPLKTPRLALKAKSVSLPCDERLDDCKWLKMLVKNILHPQVI